MNAHTISYIFLLGGVLCNSLPTSCYYSQSGQDRYLNEQVFRNKTHGTFVEIGANDGTTYSNTYFFEKERGWSGICVEPLPDAFAKLKQNRNCICINAGISDTAGTANFLAISGYSEMLSGFVDTYDPLHTERINRELAQKGGEKTIIQVTSLPLSTILQEHKLYHIDYLSIDTEGSEPHVLKSIDFDLFDIDVISIENHYNNELIHTYLGNRGYHKIQQLGSDGIYTKKKSGVIPKQFIARFLPENPVIVDAGAHIGIDTVEMSTLFPQATIHAFEPVSNLYTQLCANSKCHQTIRCYPLALSNETGSASLNVSEGASDGSSSLLEPKEHLIVHPNVTFTKTIAVPTITLDQWAQDNGVDHVDFLWLDLQGSELSVLKASPHILKTVSVIYTEVSLIETYNNAPLYPELKAWLEAEGFTVIKEELPWKDMGNVLFVRL